MRWFSSDSWNRLDFRVVEKSEEDRAIIMTSTSVPPELAPASAGCLTLRSGLQRRPTSAVRTMVQMQAHAVIQTIISHFFDTELHKICNPQ